MNPDLIVIVVVALLCAACAVVMLVTGRRPRQHYWLDPEPPLRQRQCAVCERPIFYAKTTEGKTLTLDASVPIYVQVKTDNDITRVCQVAAYIEHAALCHALTWTIPNGKVHHAE